MSRSPLVLPPEAAELIEQVRTLDAHARRINVQLQGDLAGIRKAASDERADLKRQRTELAHDRAVLEALLESRVRGFEFIAGAWADYERARAARLATSLQYKKHPAKNAAEEVRAKGKELAAMRRELKRTQWVLALYEFQFPWLSELRDFDEELSYVEGEPELVGADSDGAADQQPDPAQRFLSKEEYAALSDGRTQPERARPLPGLTQDALAGRARLRALHRLPARAGRREGHLPGHLRRARRPGPRPDRETPTASRSSSASAGPAQDDPRKARLSALRHRRRHAHRATR